MKHFAVCLMLLACAPLVRGGGCATTFRSYTPTVSTYASSAYVAPSYSYNAIQLVTPVLPVYTAPAAYGALYYPPALGYGPGYGASYGGGHGAAAATGSDPCAETKKELGDLKARFARMEGFLEGKALGGGGSVAPRPERAVDPMPKAAVPSARLELTVASCASCHGADTAATKGGKFALTSGDGLAKMAPQQIGEVMRRLALPDDDPASMPRGKKLSPAIKLAIINEFIAAQSQ